MAYKTLGGGLDLSLSMESKSNSLPLMMSAGGRFGGIFKGFWGSIFGKRVRDATLLSIFQFFTFAARI